MHVVVGFDSRIAAQGAALALVDAARLEGVAIAGAALARRNFERGINVGALAGFDFPEHVLGTLDRTVDSDGDSHPLAPGQTALIIASSADEPAMTKILRAAALDANGALWVQLVDAG
jgi:hypothetical protein